MAELDLGAVERRMQPGAWDAAGFLAPGDLLGDVLARDAQTLRSLGVEAAAIGERLEGLLRAAETDVFTPVLAGPYEIQILRQRGLITCPWAPEEFEPCPSGGGMRPTANRFRLRHRPSGRTLEGFELSAHLIRAHAFFGGPGTRFRLEPERLATFLEMPRSRSG